MIFSDLAPLLARARAGDADAADALARRLGPYLRRLVRMRLTAPGLRRQCDSADVCQSVLRRLWEAAAADRLELTPERLAGLLATLARNNVIDKARRAARAPVADWPADLDPPAPGPSPSHGAAARELADRLRARLTERERLLLDGRAEGRSWPELAAQLGGSPDALRVAHARAVAKARRWLAAGG